MSEIYRPLYINQGPLLFTSRRTAELIKYAANAFLATKITFINEMADLCEALGADVQDVSRGIGLDNRIGSKFLHAGPGYGGSCFPKDTLALIKTAETAGSRARIVETVVEVNELRKMKMADRVIAACDGTVLGKTIAVLGLTFKPNTDDMRDSPSIPICGALLAAGAEVIAYDPAGTLQAAPLMPGVRFAKNAYDCIEDAEAMVLVTEWEVFRALNLKRVKSLMKAPLVIDMRNVYRSSEMTSLGFRYVGIGRGLRSKQPDN
jgi:UDPglucose 6-dehydrogenase